MNDQIRPEGMTVAQIAREAREASRELTALSLEQRNKALYAMAAALDEKRETLIAANAQDMEAARAGQLDAPLLSRLELNHRKIDQLIDGTYHEDKQLFRPIYDSLLNGWNGSVPDPYFILADFRSYADAHARVQEAYRDKARWAKMAMMNTAKSGKFSSDRTIKEYADEIWNLKPVTVDIE